MPTRLHAAGRAADRIRRHDWATSRMGALSASPDELTNLLGVVLESAQPMFIVWGDGQILLHNDAYGDILGAREADATGTPFLEVWPDIADELLPLVEDTYAGRASHMTDIALQLRRDDGLEEAHFSFSYTPVRLADGRVAGFLCACLETTGQVRWARNMRDSDAQNRQIFDSVIDYAIIPTDFEGLVTRWNEGARHILGWTEEEMLGERLDHFFTPEDRAANRPRVEMRCALEIGRGNDKRWHMRKDGSCFWASGEMMTQRDANHRPVGFVKVLRDRTAERRQYEDLKELNATLEERVAQEVEH